MRAPKADIPMYHQGSREHGRLAFPSTRRRRTSSNSRRRGSSSAFCCWVVIISPLVIFAFCLGTFLGLEIAHRPGGKDNSGSSGYVPPLKHPSGWNIHGARASNDRLNGAFADPHLRGVHDEHLPPQGSEGRKDRANGDGMGAAGGGGGNPWLQSHSFRAREGCYVSVKEGLDHSQEVTASAWVFLDSEKPDITTILGNKMSGCGSDALGFAMYVNEWEKNDGELWLEWGDGAHGCEKLRSQVRVPVGQWVHVAARMHSSDGVALFIGGKKVSSALGSRKPGSREEFTIGAFANGGFPFLGRISAVTVFGSALADDQIAELAALSGKKLLSDALVAASIVPHYPSLLVALQLDETVGKEKDGVVARHAGNSKDHEGGLYHFLHMQEPPEVDHDLKDGISTTTVTEEMRRKSDEKGRERAKEVKAAMEHAWKGYEKYAWGADELAPRGMKRKESWGGMGVTLVDSLDTLWLMGMKDEFWKARNWVRDHLSFSNAGEVSVFETTIRELGGLLSAYDLSGDEIFKKKAVELGNLLLPAFDTNSGIPTPRVSFKTGHKTGSKSVLAEVGTLQVEFRYLSRITGDPIYADKANLVFDVLHDLHPRDGLFPIFINSATGASVGSTVTFGALGDSFYEYLLKAWLQGGQAEPTYRHMYDEAMDGMTRKLLQKSDPSGLLYVSDWDGHRNVAKMDHLVCFLAGTLALGAQTAVDPMVAERDMKTAKALAYTCYQMYARQKTGLAPEMVTFEAGKDMVVSTKTAYNILRPETAEALFVLHQITGDPIYREWSWDIFQAFEKHCRLPVAFGSFPNVNNPMLQPEDRMESFFLGETLKYLYLIQDPDHKVDLTKYVFNTEAHPTRIFTEMEES